MEQLPENPLGFTPVTPAFIGAIALYTRKSEGAKGITFLSRKLESLLLGRIYIVADTNIDDYNNVLRLSKSMQAIGNAKLMLGEIERRLTSGEGDHSELLHLAYRIFAVAEEEFSG